MTHGEIALSTVRWLACSSVQSEQTVNAKYILLVCFWENGRGQDAHYCKFNTFRLWLTGDRHIQRTKDDCTTFVRVSPWHRLIALVVTRLARNDE